MLLDAPSRLGQCDTSPRRCPPWLDRQWEQQLTLNSVTAVNCRAAQVKPCKCYANCGSPRCPALMMHPASKRGKSAVGRRFRVFCVCLRRWWIQSSRCHCQNGIHSPACCHFRAVKTHINGKHSLLFYCTFILEFQKFDFRRMCLGGISALWFHPYTVGPTESGNHRAAVPLPCPVYLLAEMTISERVQSLLRVPSGLY